MDHRKFFHHLSGLLDSMRTPAAPRRAAAPRRRLPRPKPSVSHSNNPRPSPG